MLILVLTIQIYQAFILLGRHARKKPIATYDINNKFIIARFFFQFALYNFRERVESGITVFFHANLCYCGSYIFIQ